MRLQVPDPVSASEQEQNQSLADDLTASVSSPSEHFSQAARRAGCLQPTASARLWTTRQLAEHLQVSVGWVYDRTRQNGPDLIPHLKLGKYVRFEPACGQFRTWLEAQRVSGETPSSASANRHSEDTQQHGESASHTSYTEDSLSDRTSRRKEASK